MKTLSASLLFVAIAICFIGAGIQADPAYSVSKITYDVTSDSDNAYCCDDCSSPGIVTTAVTVETCVEQGTCGSGRVDTSCGGHNRDAYNPLTSKLERRWYSTEAACDAATSGYTVDNGKTYAVDTCLSTGTNQRTKYTVSGSTTTLAPSSTAGAVQGFFSVAAFAIVAAMMMIA